MRAQITASASTMSHYLKSEFSVKLLLIIFSLQASIEGEATIQIWWLTELWSLRTFSIYKDDRIEDV
jgi:uncharacterized membrane protein